jgi:hypothetical protein
VNLPFAATIIYDDKCNKFQYSLIRKGETVRFCFRIGVERRLGNGGDWAYCPALMFQSGND